MKLIKKYKTGGDYDPDHPYHYHTKDGQKVIITEDDWNANVGQPYFKNIEEAVNAERQAYSVPEYEIDPEFVKGLSNSHAAFIAQNDRAYNYSGLSHQLPEGYTMDSNGLLLDKDGNAYVIKWYNGKYTYDTEKPLNITFYKGKPIEKNVTFYPVNMDRRVKAPLPVNRTLNVDKEYNDAVTDYIKNNNIRKLMYYTPWIQSSADPVIYVYGNKNALSSGSYNKNLDKNNWFSFNYFDNGVDEAEHYSASNLMTEEEIIEALKHWPQAINNPYPGGISFWKAGYKQRKPSRKEAEKKAVINIDRFGGCLQLVPRK